MTLQSHQVLVKRFCDRWSETHKGEKFPVQNFHFKAAYDVMNVPEGFDPPSLDSLFEKIDVYLANRDDFVVGCRHNIMVFFKHLHRWGVRPDPNIRLHKICNTEYDTRKFNMCPVCNPGKHSRKETEVPPIVADVAKLMSSQ